MQIEIQRVAHTIDDLLSLAMLEDDSSRPKEAVEIDAVVAGALDRISETAEQRDIKVIVSTDADITPLRGPGRGAPSWRPRAAALRALC